MHRQDKIAIGLCSVSACMGAFRQLVPEGWPSLLFYTVWVLPVFWFVLKVWRSFTPRCSLREWYHMYRLGYRWMANINQFSQHIQATHYDSRFVSRTPQGWKWHRLYEIGNHDFEHVGGPTTTPTGAHILGCLQNWKSE